MNLVRNNAGDTVINNPAIPNDKNDEVVRDVSNNISEGLKEETDRGNMQSIMDLFNSSDESSMMKNPAVGGIMSKVTASLSSKFGVSPQIAQQIASTLLPKVMSQFVNKTKDPNDRDFDLQDIAKNLGAGDLLGKLSGEGGLGGLGKMFGR